jgi:hypothetical protein
MANRMTGKNGITAQEAIQAAKDSQGFVTTIAAKLGCTRDYVYKLQKKYPTFAQAILEEREGLKDFAEGKLLEQIKAGNMTGIIFYLKTQASDRGYIERHRIEIAMAQEVEKFKQELESRLDSDTFEKVLAAFAKE